MRHQVQQHAQDRGTGSALARDQVEQPQQPFQKQGGQRHKQGRAEWPGDLGQQIAAEDRAEARTLRMSVWRRGRVGPWPGSRLRAEFGR